MMIISKTVNVCITRSNYHHYNNLGYTGVKINNRIDILIYCIYEKIYHELIKYKIDAVYSSGELVLINKNSIEYFSELKRWNRINIIQSIERGKPIENTDVEIKNDVELEQFLKKNLGKYYKVNSNGKELYFIDDDNIEKGYIYYRNVPSNYVQANENKNNIYTYIKKVINSI